MNDLEKRLNDLEIKFAYQDELLNELNLIVAKQQKKNDDLTKALKAVSNKVSAGSSNSLDKDEKPPHY